MLRKFSPLNFRFLLLASCAAFLSGCETPLPPDQGPSKVQIVATTSIVADTARQIGGAFVNVEALMGPGIDPHLYKASAGDVERLADADIVLYTGLHLEAGMATVFEKMPPGDRAVVAVTKDIPKDMLIPVEGFDGNYDPHVWMDPSVWKPVAETIAETIIKEAPDKEKDIRTNLDYFLGSLRMLDANIRNALTAVPKEGRVIITAHDAFSYFGKAYDFEVRGLQGVSTASEAGAMDVQSLAKLIVERKIPAIFVESSVPRRNVEALQEAVKAKGFDVRIGRPLFSDSVGDYGTAQASYIGMIRYNAGIIAEELTPKAAK